MKGLIAILAAIITMLYFGVGLTSDTNKSSDDKPIKSKELVIGNIRFTPHTKPLNETRELLKKQAPTMKPEVIDTTVASLECAKQNKALHSHTLTIIDYSLPSDKKRMWVFDLDKNKLLHHTYVSHAIMSGSKKSNYFSNVNNSKASSLGIFQTENTYDGRYGAALKLRGLDGKFNDKAYKRYIVLHGSWYTTDKFIKKYGRAGRSWGCPTVPVHQAEKIVNAIKNRGFMVVYYPESTWLTTSAFLNCAALANHKLESLEKKGVKLKQKKEIRSAVIFADANGNNKHDKFEPIVVIKADDYVKIFKKKAPLTRMVRRQIKDKEYIALNHNELKKLNKEKLDIHYFVVPEIIRKGGRYFQTKIVFVEKQPPGILKSTEDFIRWLGL